MLGGGYLCTDNQQQQSHANKNTTTTIAQGNYLFLDDHPWTQLRPLFDETVFVDCPIDVAMRRVTARQLAIGLAPEVSAARVAGNDRPNAEMVAATAGVARLIVPSTVAPSDPSSLDDENGGSGSGISSEKAE
jgi:pantothenate kinase